MYQDPQFGKSSANWKWMVIISTAYSEVALQDYEGGWPPRG